MKEDELLNKLQELATKWLGDEVPQEKWLTIQCPGREYEGGVQAGYNACGEVLQEILDHYYRTRESNTPEQWLPSASDMEDFDY